MLNLKLKKWFAIGWMVFTVLPFIYFPLSMIILTGDMWTEPSGAFEKKFDIFFNYVVVLNVLFFLLTASYLIYLFSTPYVPREKRMLWVVILLFVNVIAMPFFWYWYVWSPLKSESESKIEHGKLRSNFVPIVMGIGMFSFIPAIMLLDAYYRGHAYNDLAEAFPVNNSDSAYTEISSGDVSIAKQMLSKRSVWLKDVLSVSISDESIRFKASPVMGLLYRSFEIPASAVHSCSKQCGGSTDYILLLDKTNYQIDIEDAPEILEWCWDNKLPILASSQRREWLYKGSPLPERNALAITLEDRSKYDYAARQACLGY